MSPRNPPTNSTPYYYITTCMHCSFCCPCPLSSRTTNSYCFLCQDINKAEREGYNDYALSPSLKARLCDIIKLMDTQYHFMVIGNYDTDNDFRAGQKQSLEINGCIQNDKGNGKKFSLFTSHGVVLQINAARYYSS